MSEYKISIVTPFHNVEMEVFKEAYESMTSQTIGFENVEWIIDSTNSIVSRIYKFPIDNKSFPLTLANAIIGPKCPDQASNVDQFNYMNRQQKIIKETFLQPAVKPSKIDNYR